MKGKGGGRNSYLEESQKCTNYIDFGGKDVFSKPSAHSKKFEFHVMDRVPLTLYLALIIETE